MQISKLREICQRSREQEFEKENTADQILRFFSIYLTAILIKTKITPNQISILSILVGLFGVITIPRDMFIGVLIVYLYLILDACDGEVARYKKLTSYQGKYLDYMAYIIVFTFFWVVMARNYPVLLVMCLIGFFWFEIAILSNFQIYTKAVKSGEIDVKISGPPTITRQPGIMGLIKKLALEATGYVEVITATLILSIFDLGGLIIIYYALAKFGLAIINIYYEYKHGVNRLL